MSALDSYRMRLKRKKYRIRAFRKRRELKVVADRTGAIKRGHLLAFTTLRNERVRLPYFLDYYRKAGVRHFFMVDNASDDGSREYLADQEDVSLWTTAASYRRARFGVDWLNWLALRHAHGHWALTVDVDEFLVYPFCDTRPINALTDWLDGSGLRSFSAMLLDMYPKGPIDAQTYAEGQDPFEIASWFDSGNYMITRNDRFQNLWIQGGPRARAFFADAPLNAPSLNKIPLVKWDRAYCYVNSTHMLLPRGLNLTYDEEGGEKTCGALLHAKFLNTFIDKTEEEITRREHFAGSREYLAYHAVLKEQPDLWTKWSEQYINWRQLEILGLVSKGNWT
ncbi:glycosyltransferase family 2 protein [Roseicyclus sp. F158]|uniref:Glycosyltransferase family 2 protein n=2 Tax=Tropicimonas omnivorans TaxID=3075590 RepID=A0ABU3DCY5_9RHOB|nr:glycosyltransferase family 2 protein [Roseicyclus sp. F158]MDT0681557.1 glycosyltransferase family 2 protein [Roseicyclus sp. F158]